MCSAQVSSYVQQASRKTLTASPVLPPLALYHPVAISLHFTQASEICTKYGTLLRSTHPFRVKGSQILCISPRVQMLVLVQKSDSVRCGRRGGMGMAVVGVRGKKKVVSYLIALVKVIDTSGVSYECTCGCRHRGLSSGDEGHCNRAGGATQCNKTSNWMKAGD